MNHLVLCLLFAVLLPIASAEPASNGQIHEMQLRRNTSRSDVKFIIHGTEIRDTDALKAFVAKLPKGAILRWDSGCSFFRTLPLPGPTVKFSEFRALCTEHGINFQFICGF